MSEQRLFRLEHPKDNRLGPWVSRKSTGIESWYSRHHNHNPSNGPGWCDDQITPPLSTRDRYFTFVRSIDELKWWFRPIHLRHLRSDGFVVGEYMLPSQWVKHGHRQAAGLREMGRHVRDIPLTHILKGKVHD